MDAYVVSANIIGIIFSLFTYSQSNVLIPFLGSVESGKEQNSVSVSIVHFNIIFFGILSMLMYLFSLNIMSVLAPGLTYNQKLIGSSFIKITSLYLFFSNVGSLGKGIIELNLQPILSQLIKFLQATFLVLVLWLLHVKYGIYALPWSHVASTLLILPFYLFYITKKGINLLSFSGVWNEHIKDYLFLLLPVLLGQLLMRAIKISDSYLASFLSAGSLSQMNYSLRIVNNFNILFSGIFLVYFPLLSKLNSNEKNGEHFAVFKEGFEFLFWAVLAVTIFFVIFAPEIIQIVFERGSFTSQDTLVVANLSRSYVLMIICSPLGTYFANVYYSRKASKRVAIYSGISSITNIVLNILFVKFWGVYGLAIASSIAYLLGNVVQLFNLHRLNPEFKYRIIFKGPVIKVITIYIVVGALALAYHSMFDVSLFSFNQLLFWGLGTFLLYTFVLIAVSYCFKLSFVYLLVSKFKKNITKKV